MRRKQPMGDGRLLGLFCVDAGKVHRCELDNRDFAAVRIAEFAEAMAVVGSYSRH
jgi:hypothetical protein